MAKFTKEQMKQMDEITHVIDIGPTVTLAEDIKHCHLFEAGFQPVKEDWGRVEEMKKYVAGIIAWYVGQQMVNIAGIGIDNTPMGLARAKKAYRDYWVRFYKYPELLDFEANSVYNGWQKTVRLRASWLIEKKSERVVYV